MRRMLASRGFTAMRSSSSHRMIRTGTPPMRGAFASSSTTACSSLMFRVWAGSTVKTALLYSIRLTRPGRRPSCGYRGPRSAAAGLCWRCKRQSPADVPRLGGINGKDRLAVQHPPDHGAQGGGGHEDGAALVVRAPPGAAGRVSLELVKADTTQTTTAGAFLFEETLETIVETGFIADSYVEGANYATAHMRKAPLLATPISSPPSSAYLVQLSSGRMIGKASPEIPMWRGQTTAPCSATRRHGSPGRG